MKRDVTGLQQESFDLIVVGGGIIGAGIARDASLRGLKTLLVEKEDFAYGTTSRSSRLIHGGLRYLRTRQFRLVRQDLLERKILLNIAPHLVHKLTFIIPLLRSEPYYRFVLPFGLYLYDVLSIGSGMSRWRRLSRSRALDIEHGLKDAAGLVGAYLYFDCQTEHMERLCLENAVSATEHGARVFNHCAATGLLIDNGNVSGVRLQDTLTGRIYTARGRIVLNAGGHWADQVWEKFGIETQYRLRRTKGIHLFTRKISDNALVLFAKSDGRLFFIIPYGAYSLVGTTDTDYSDDLDDVHATARDVEYLVREVRHYFPDFTPGDIHYTMAGLRPLVAEENKSASGTSRGHKVVDHEKEHGIQGLVTVLGGKITAYRVVAEETIDVVCRKLGLREPCRTASVLLPGAPAVSQAEIMQSAKETGLSLKIVVHLASLYGSRYLKVLEYVKQDERGKQPLCPHCDDILAQVRYSVEEECALTVSDFLLRRSLTGLCECQGLDAVETVATEMGRLLDWSVEEKQRYVAEYLRHAALGQMYKQG